MSGSFKAAIVCIASALAAVAIAPAPGYAAPGDAGRVIVRAQASNVYQGGQPAMDGGTYAAPPTGVPANYPNNGGQPVMSAGPDGFAAPRQYALPPQPMTMQPPVAQPQAYQQSTYQQPTYQPQPYSAPVATAPNSYPAYGAPAGAAPAMNSQQPFGAIPRGANLVAGNAPTARSAYYQNPVPAGAPAEGVGPGRPLVPGSPVQVFDNNPAPYVQVEPWLPVDVITNETQTGKLAVGVGVNSDAGLVGNITIDEQNFDITRWPTSWDDFREGTAFRGAGQRLRLEASPGTQVQRYLISFAEPYLFDTPVSYSTSFSYFTRIYQDWREARVGGRIGLGYYFTPDLSGNVGFRVENVRISDPTVPTPPELQRVLGHDFLYGPSVGGSHDTRDNPFLPSAGHLVRVNYEQIFGKFTYPEVTLEGRQYFKLFERPDGSGKHTLSVGSLLGFAGSDTPVYDKFFAGGFSTLRGFQFRGASPLDQNVEVGGNFEFLNTIEYMFPITADDALRGVSFVDFGTVEPNAEFRGRDFRISPGFGLRISIPAMGPAPIALDFAFPIHKAPGDRLEFFSFFVGLAR